MSFACTDGLWVSAADRELCTRAPVRPLGKPITASSRAAQPSRGCLTLDDLAS